MTWHARAACRGEPAARFYPQPHEGALDARVLCDVCPVRSECLDYAMARPEPMGVWGGLSAEQRRDLAKQRGERIAKCGHCRRRIVVAWYGRGAAPRFCSERCREDHRAAQKQAQRAGRVEDPWAKVG